MVAQVLRLKLILLANSFRRTPWQVVGVILGLAYGVASALFLAAGPALAVPFAMVTAWPPFGSFAARIGIGRLPEETARPAALLDLALPAIQMTAPFPRSNSV